MPEEIMPWEKEGETFDAEKAKALILNLRQDKHTLQERVSGLETERDTALTERDGLQTQVDEQAATLQLANDDITDRESKYQQLESLRVKENLLSDKGIPRSYATYIPDGDEEAITSAVEEFASLRGQGSVSTQPDPAQVAEPPADERAALAQQVFGN